MLKVLTFSQIDSLISHRARTLNREMEWILMRKIDGEKVPWSLNSLGFSKFSGSWNYKLISNRMKHLNFDLIYFALLSLVPDREVHKPINWSITMISQYSSCQSLYRYIEYSGIKINCTSMVYEVTTILWIFHASWRNSSQ